MLKLFKETFHGKGHTPYQSREAKKAYANSLLHVSSYLTIAAFAGVGLNTIAADSPVPFWVACAFSAVLIVGALVLRHKALLTIDAAEFLGTSSDDPT